ncbi:MAG: reverse transcriptase-like protein [Acidobacteria bacterium]|nr:reverse transcriptase-like protein [Acidobacteriota bacterium]MBS1865203.1 reverse transcriptase-like protein [Acidobacteriota bacterium]
MVRSPHTSRGGGLFGEPEPQAKPAAYRANIDGGSRGNPGPASYGVVVRDPKGEIVARLKKYIGRMTNNVAEYYGLIAALDYAQSNNIRALRIESDSELLVKQMRGQYKVKSEDLKPLFERAKKMSQSLASFRIDHVYREQNAEADALANEAMDEVSGAPRAEAGKGKMENRNSVPAEPKKLKARYYKGLLQLTEPLDLPDDTEVEILLRPLKRP